MLGVTDSGIQRCSEAYLRRLRKGFPLGDYSYKDIEGFFIVWSLVLISHRRGCGHRRISSDAGAKGYR